MNKIKLFIPPTAKFFIYALVYTIGLILLLTAFVHGQVVKKSEKEHSDDIQELLGGKREYRVTSGRVDLLTDTHAYEIEFANKWKESIGQSLWYALQSNKKPGIILIERKSSDNKYLIMLNTALEYANLNHRIQVLYYPKDFINIQSKK